ncbi:tRNA (N(6)-L-threonylcarbamoyladenosine(37)-C(2))-methylthiotransferase MtaB [bacterium]|jgi:threonylcarbamoyladenosine tRNA methylthiotransferase MtaB|nr:tRNA (N(6)-L-threonylcarbamoyladenosine(37)-C(2))-methylthiotransferase MtaB [bacterium]
MNEKIDSMKKQTTISFYTQGCRLNQSETAVLENQFKTPILDAKFSSNKNLSEDNKNEDPTFLRVPVTVPSDITVVNTCTVTERGDTDTKKLIKKLMKLNPSVKIALIGCQAQVHKEKLLEWPNVHWVVGNASKMNLKKILEDHHRSMHQENVIAALKETSNIPNEMDNATMNEFESGKKDELVETDEKDSKPQVIVPKITREPFTIPNPGIDSSHIRANIKIQDGCDFYCAFCVIPFARGPARSRVYEDIFKEVESLVESGHREIIITGINLGTYADSNKTFLDVLNRLESYEKLDRVRISSIEPTTIDDDVVHLMKTSKKLCNYFHIPLQSGSDVVLEGMKRKYTLAEFESFLSFVHKSNPDACLGTDVIVGFPGETEEEFENTYNYLRDSVLNYFHVFSYSERKFARSKRMDGQVHGAKIKERSFRLRELSHRKKMQYFSRFLGKTVEVLVEQQKKDYWEGLTENYIRVRFKTNETDLDNEDGQLKNKMVMVRLQSINEQMEKVEGELV